MLALLLNIKDDYYMDKSAPGNISSFFKSAGSRSEMSGIIM